MQINVSTDYAVRMVMYMATHRGVITSNELSEKLKIPQSITLKIGKKLSNNGIAHIATGIHGGISLKKGPADISLFDIINLFEPTMKISRCLEEDEFCSRHATDNCPVRKFYCDFQEKIEEDFMTTTIQNLIET